VAIRVQNPLAQGPGPPQRPHIPGGVEGDGFALAPSAPTAKTLSVRAVFLDPHLGQGIFSSLFMLRTSFSKFSLQSWQAYS
jgi:hypothetical protein